MQPVNVSLAASLASLSEAQRTAILNDLSDREIAALEYDWRFWGRPNQIAPGGDWLTWLVLAGRGFGKTEAGAQWVRERVRDGARQIALVAETQKDLEEVMVARLLAVHPPSERPSVRYRPVRMTWPNGAIAYGYNGTEPDQLRGPEFDTAWVDELAKYRYARETWDMLQFTMRRGQPRQIVTTTPKPLKLLRELMADARTIVTRGSTRENAANLAPTFLQAIRDKYEGTRLGRQELEAELLEEAEGALWTRAQVEACHVKQPPEMLRVVVAIDPAVTETEESAETGIVVAGLGMDRRGYVLADVSGRRSPAAWTAKAIEMFDRFKADRIVAEGNQGGNLVTHAIHTARANAPVKIVHARVGKRARAEPVAALYEQGKVSHCAAMPDLEDQMVNWEPLSGLPSPDRLDALVWALTELMVGATITGSREVLI